MKHNTKDLTRKTTSKLIDKPALNTVQISDKMKKLALNISRIIRESSSQLIAIDGRCASGKTTLADELRCILSCNVVHMDHFFLRPEQRTLSRLNTPGENVDHERFLREVLLPLKNGDRVSYRPFDCKTMSFGETIELDSERITIVEGSYSCHNDLYKHYNLRIFLSVPPDEQMQRIILREGKEKAKTFESKWIPLEENYFKTFNIAKRCDLCFTT